MSYKCLTVNAQNQPEFQPNPFRNNELECRFRTSCKFLGWASEMPIPKSNGNFYKTANVEFQTMDGKTVQKVAMVNEGHYKNYPIEEGKQYVMELVVGTDKRILLLMSHLPFTGLTSLSADDLGISMPVVNTAAVQAQKPVFDNTPF